MKLEQACRFRLDKGYCIFAQSEGFDKTHEDAMGKCFNDAMNTIFPSYPRPGESVLSCAAQDGYTYIARNTLRTDIMGRPTIFSHTYVLSTEQYSRIMLQQPELLLSLSLTDMKDYQSQGETLPALEPQVPAEHGFDLQALFEKYNLTPERYTRLLLGAYSALTSNGSLCLKTEKPFGQTDLVTRELVYCVNAGLLPALRGRLTFCTGADRQRKIITLSAQEKNVQPSDFIFGVDDDRYTNIRPLDQVSAAAFQALGSMSHQERAATLGKMQTWLDEVTGTREGMSLMLVATAYFMATGQDMTTDAKLIVFSSLAKGKGIDAVTVDRLLTKLLTSLNAEGCGSPQAASLIAEWYLMESSGAFCDQADTLLRRVSEEVSAALLDAVLDLEMTDRSRRMLLVLVEQVPPQSEHLTAEAREQTVRWFLREDVKCLAEYCAVLLEGFNDAQMKELAMGILRDARGQELKVTAKGVLHQTVARLAVNENRDFALMPEVECAQLYAHVAEYSQEMLESVLDYFFRVQLASCGEIPAMLDLLEAVELDQPRFMDGIRAQMAAGREGTGLLWEHYQTGKCFRGGEDCETLAEICQRYNTFHNPGGIFEKHVEEEWLQNIRAFFATLDFDRYQMSYIADVIANRYIQQTENLQVSGQVRDNIIFGIAQIFWDSVSFEMIYQSDFRIPQTLRVEIPSAAMKQKIIGLCQQLLDDPRDTKEFIQAVTRPGCSDKELERLIECAGKMTFVLLREKYFLSWDLILLSCWIRTEKGNTFDLDALVEKTEGVESWLGKKAKGKTVRTTSHDSNLLKNEQLRKAVYKMNTNDAPRLLEKLVEELRPEKKGLFGLFGGGKKEAPAPKKGQPADKKGVPTPFRDDPRGGAKGKGSGKR